MFDLRGSGNVLSYRRKVSQSLASYIYCRAGMPYFIFLERDYPKLEPNIGSSSELVPYRSWGWNKVNDYPGYFHPHSNPVSRFNSYRGSRPVPIPIVLVNSACAKIGVVRSVVLGHHDINRSTSGVSKCQAVSNRPRLHVGTVFNQQSPGEVR